MKWLPAVEDMSQLWGGVRISSSLGRPAQCFADSPTFFAQARNLGNPVLHVAILADVGVCGVFQIFLHAAIDGTPLGEIGVELPTELAVAPRAVVFANRLTVIRIHDESSR